MRSWMGNTKQSDLINPRTELLKSRVVVSVRTPETDSARRGRCGELMRMLPDKRGRAFLRAASTGLQTVHAPAPRLIAAPGIRSEVKHASVSVTRAHRGDGQHLQQQSAVRAT